MLGMATENNQGYLLSLKAYRPDVLLLMETQQARNGNFGGGLTSYCADHGIQLKREIIPEEDSVPGLLEFLQQLAQKFCTVEDTITVNLAGGTKLHNIALWEFFRQSPQAARAVFLNLQTAEKVEWLKDASGFSQIKAPLETEVGLDEIVGLYGFKLTYVLDLMAPDARQKLTRIMKQPFRSQNGSDQGRGEQFERACANSMLQLLEEGQLPKARAVYFNMKILKDDSVVRAEYDFAIQTKKNELVLVECKSGDNFKLKSLKSQKELAAEWGGAFARFAVFVSAPATKEDEQKLKSKHQNSADHDLVIFTGPSLTKAMKGMPGLEAFGRLMRLKN